MIRKYAALMALAVFTLVNPEMGWAREADTLRAGAFPSFIPFDATQAEFPEGVAVDKVGNVYVSIGGFSGPRGEIWKFTASGERSVLTDFGTPGALGLAVDAVGNVYVGRSVAPDNGVYVVDRHGQARRLPGTEQMVFPNALAFDQQGNLYVAESFSIDSGGGFGAGGIWRISRGGTAQLWLRHELLTGSGPTLFPFPIGANGLAFYHGALFVINTEKALVVRIPVHQDGSAGQPEIWKEVLDVPESLLFGYPIPLMLDGLALDVHGNLFIAVPSRAAVIRISASDRSQETIAVFYHPTSPPLDAPASLAFGTGKGERENLFVSNLGISGLLVPGIPWVGPGLVKITAGSPGLPLP